RLGEAALLDEEIGEVPVNRTLVADEGALHAALEVGEPRAQRLDGIDGLLAEEDRDLRLAALLIVQAIGVVEAPEQLRIAAREGAAHAAPEQLTRAVHLALGAVALHEVPDAGGGPLAIRPERTLAKLEAALEPRA